MYRIVSLVAVLACASPLAAQSVRCAAQDIGSMTYTSCSDGSRVSTQRIGSQTYSTYSDGSRSSTQRIGSTTYYNDSRGNQGATDRIGSFTYTTITGPSGSVRGSSQRIGNTTYGRYTATETPSPYTSSLPPLPVLPGYP